MIYNQQEFKVTQGNISHEFSSNYSLPNDFYSIDQYLNLENYYFKEQSQIDRINNESMEIQTQNFPNSESTPSKKQKSVFHNFQKHLITLIKKFIHLPKNSLVFEPFGPIAHNIWHQFMASGISNKKMLNLVFGSTEMNREELQSQRATKEFSVFKKLFDKHPYSQICAAQQLLRLRVIAQARALSKQLLKSSSNVGRFEEFYSYFQAFLEELEKGPLTRRMTKSCKHKMLMQNPPLSVNSLP